MEIRCAVRSHRCARSSDIVDVPSSRARGCARGARVRYRAGAGGGGAVGAGGGVVGVGGVGGVVAAAKQIATVIRRFMAVSFRNGCASVQLTARRRFCGSWKKGWRRMKDER